jgi:hypothetical protein
VVIAKLRPVEKLTPAPLLTGRESPGQPLTKTRPTITFWGTSDQFMNERVVPKMTNFCVAYMDVGEAREQER